MYTAKKMNLMQAMFLTMAFFASIRRIPNVAAAGWESIFFMAFAVVMFVIPISFISAELATAMPVDGGLPIWVGKALSPRWGFVAAWLVWIQMCFGMVTVGATFADMVATIFNIKWLVDNDVFIGLVIIALYWLVTFLMIKGFPITSMSTYGTIFGLFVPLAILLIFGTIYAATTHPEILTPPSLSEMIPSSANVSELSNLSGIIFMFAGMEQISNFANRLDQPRRDYPRAIILATLLIAGLFNYAGLIMDGLMKQSSIILTDPAQVYSVIFSGWGMGWMTAIVAAMISLSCVTEMSAWIVGPCRGVLRCAQSGFLPPVFQKTGRSQRPVNIMILQAIIVTVVALMFVCNPATNGVEHTVLTMTVVLYCVVYVLILLSGIFFRHKYPNDNHTFKIRGGMPGMCSLAGIGLLGVGFVIFSSFIPPDGFASSQKIDYILFMIIGMIAFSAIPLLFYRFRKSSWRMQETPPGKKTD